MDAITLLKEDHRKVEGLFARFEGAGKRARETKRKIADQVIRELAMHSAVEEQVFYPTVRERVRGAEDEVLEDLEEHHIVKWTLSELDRMDPQDERFEAKFRVLMENVRHHVKEEERQLFPQVRKALGRADLEELGRRMEQAKRAAPTLPHPRAPDTPPANLFAGPAAAVVDAAREALRGVRDELSGRDGGDAEEERSGEGRRSG